MKKLLILAAVAAMACGAKAITYNYSLTISDCPKSMASLPADLVSLVYVNGSLTTTFKLADLSKEYISVIPLNSEGKEVPFDEADHYDVSFGSGGGWKFDWDTKLTEADTVTSIVASFSTGYYQRLETTPAGSTYHIGASGPYQNVPEPTSGLLMLLGLAGLALKRKRA